MLALQRKSAGTIHFLGRSFDTATRDDRRKLRARMQVVFQDPFGSLSPRMTIEEIVGEGLPLHQPGLSREATRGRVMVRVSSFSPITARTINSCAATLPARASRR